MRSQTFDDVAVDSDLDVLTHGLEGRQYRVGMGPAMANQDDTVDPQEGRSADF